MLGETASQSNVRTSRLRVAPSPRRRARRTRSRRHAANESVDDFRDRCCEIRRTPSDRSPRRRRCPARKPLQPLVRAAIFRPAQMRLGSRSTCRRARVRMPVHRKRAHRGLLEDEVVRRGDRPARDNALVRCSGSQIDESEPKVVLGDVRAAPQFVECVPTCASPRIIPHRYPALVVGGLGGRRDRLAAHSHQMIVLREMWSLVRPQISPAHVLPAAVREEAMISAGDELRPVFQRDAERSLHGLPVRAGRWFGYIGGK